MTIVNVAMADIKVAVSPTTLVTILGSCVGVALYDPEIKIGGLSHIMLPNREESKGDPMKYADSAIDLLMGLMEKRGVIKARKVAKIVGGANMFPSIKKGTTSDIGKRHIDAVKKKLKEEGIRIIAEDIHGDFGRSIEFYMINGKIIIKRSGKTSCMI